MILSNKMVDTFNVNHLEIRDTYERGIKTVLKRLNTSPNLTNIATYKKLNETAQKDDLRLNIVDDVNERFLIQNQTFLKQARYFSEVAFREETPSEVKPLLFYYAEQTLFAFYVYSLFHYENHSKHHGLSMVWKKNNVELEIPNILIEKEGFFSRILDAYSLLTDRKFKFLPYVHNNSTIEKNDDSDSFLVYHELSLEKIIKLRDESHQPSGLESDILDYLLLFYSSSLARYKPHMWVKISEGKKELYHFNQAFDRFKVLYARLLEDICYIHNHGVSGIFLMMPDVQLKATGHHGLM